MEDESGSEVEGKGLNLMLTPLPTLGILFENSQSGSDPARYDINLIKARDGLLQMVIHLNLISLITTAGNRKPLFFLNLPVY